MSNIAIHAKNLGKMYRIGGIQESYKTFREVITRTAMAPFLRTQALLSGQAYGAAGLHEELWALKDISFEVKHGDVVGIIGPNGAGKSTLLKVLSQITEPTEGYIDVYGRVGALLEVGTGFHPELTGRENIYLNGAILGMSRKEIDRKFDEIVMFAEVERFIDTPVKHYSSGMGLRLGFAVAAHLEPEILVIDEVLAVGDAAFQKKCLGKMSSVADEGRTVLFVSHSMSAILSLCKRCIWIDHGQIKMMDETASIVQAYQASLGAAKGISLAERNDRKGSGVVRFTNIAVSGNDAGIIAGSTAQFVVELVSTHGNPIGVVSIAIVIQDIYGNRLFSFDTHLSGLEIELDKSFSQVVCQVSMLPLLPGHYQVYISCSGRNREILDAVENANEFVVLESDFLGSGKLPKANKHGPILVEHTWSIKNVRNKGERNLDQAF